MIWQAVLALEGESSGIVHFRLAAIRAFDASDQIELLAASPQFRFHARNMFRWNYQDHPKPQIKSLQQLVAVDFAQAREVAKNRKHGPLVELNDCLNPGRKSAWQISSDASSSNVGHGGNP